nr:O-methyltransferase [Aquibacillus albus]
MYLTRMLPSSDEWVSKLENYAYTHGVPIMEPLGINFLMQLVRLQKPTNILEIGTAIGYSSLRMLEACPSASIVTVERDENRYMEAVNNIKDLNKQKNIHVIHGDALEVVDLVVEKGPYDLLFIDAAKGQYQRFFEMYSKHLTEDAVIISDNVLFKGLVADQSLENERLSKIARKINSYNEWLVNHPDYRTTIVPIGDGVAISVKR